MYLTRSFDFGPSFGNSPNSHLVCQTTLNSGRHRFWVCRSLLLMLYCRWQTWCMMRFLSLWKFEKKKQPKMEKYNGHFKILMPNEQFKFKASSETVFFFIVKHVIALPSGMNLRLYQFPHYSCTLYFRALRQSFSISEVSRGGSEPLLLLAQTKCMS